MNRDTAYVCYTNHQPYIRRRNVITCVRVSTTGKSAPAFYPCSCARSVNEAHATYVFHAGFRQRLRWWWSWCGGIGRSRHIGTQKQNKKVTANEKQIAYWYKKTDRPSNTNKQHPALHICVATIISYHDEANKKPPGVPTAAGPKGGASLIRPALQYAPWF